MLKRHQYFKTRVKTLLQYSETECGIAALAMIMNFYQVYVPLEQLREKCGTSRDGCKATTLLEVAKEFGFKAEGYRVELEDIIKLGQPVIAFWNFNHYVVITGADHTQVYINDPAQGKLKISLKEFDKSFTGIVLSLTPMEQGKQLKSNHSLKEYFLAWLSSFKWEWLFILLLSLLFISVPLLNSIISSIFINYCVIGTDKHWLPWLGMFAMVLAVFMMFVSRAQQGYQFKLTAKASLLKSTELIIHTLKLPLLYFSLRQKSEIIAILARAEAVINSFFTNLTSLMLNSFMLVCCVVAMLFINSSLTCKLLLLITLLASVTTSLARNSFDLEKRFINSESKLYAAYISNLRNRETIKACAIEYEMLAKWYRIFSKKVESRSSLNTITTKIASLNQFFSTLCLMTMLYCSWQALMQGTISLGNLLAYYSLLLFATKAAAAILQAWQYGQKAYAAHLRINDLKRYPVDKCFIDDKPRAKMGENTLSLDCSKLDFYYNKRSAPVLNQISLKIQYGQQIALVGSSGSGKSTLAKLLCGLYPFERGDICLAGLSLTEFTASDFCRYFSYVSQEVSLFSGTIYENLTLGQLDVPLAEINSVIQLTCLNELIDQRGLYGSVEEMGSNFSGGERQRLEIARALLWDAPILILDEATSALDVRTEAIIMENLRSLAKTIVYVAHRLSTIRHCEQIYVLDQGQIIEQGSHEKLLQDKAQYYRLVQQELISEC